MNARSAGMGGCACGQSASVAFTIAAALVYELVPARNRKRAC
jgi:predicted outer membrane lipoprotein